MNKNEMINEMANDLAKCISYDEWSSREYGMTEVDYTDTAINLYKKKNYRKIADDEIVVKKSEYEALKKDYNEWKDEYDHNCLLRLEVFELEKQLKKAKQETAREILQELDKALDECQIVSEWGVGQGYEKERILKCFWGLIDKYGIELE